MAQLFIIQRRHKADVGKPAEPWKTIGSEFDYPLAEAIVEDLIADGMTEARALDWFDIATDEAEKLHKAFEELSVEDHDRYEPIRIRAIMRLHQEGR